MISSEFAEFEATQRDIYSKLHAADAGIRAGNEGLQRDVGGLGEPGAERTAFLVAYRLDPETTEKIGDFSLRVAEVVPAITYGPENSHVTLFDCHLFGEPIDPNSADSQEVLGGLARGVQAGLSRVHRTSDGGPEIFYGNNTVATPNNVLALGVPVAHSDGTDPLIFDIRQQILAATGQEGVEPRGSWGHHTTINRFTENRPPEEMGDLMDIMAEVPDLGRAKPASVDVATFRASDKGFVLSVYDSFPLDGGRMVAPGWAGNS